MTDEQLKQESNDPEIIEKSGQRENASTRPRSDIRTFAGA